MTANIIFVLSNGRTGSTLLCQALKNYQHTINFNEAHFLSSNDLFYTDINFGNFLCNNIKTDILFKCELKSKLLADPIKLLTTISDYYTNTNDTIILKLHLHQFRFLSDKMFNWIFSQLNHKFILLKRDNYLEKYVSEVIAEQSNIWQNGDTTNVKIKIDIPDYIMKMNKRKRQYDKIKQDLNNHDIDALLVEYDKDLKHYDNNDFINLVDPWVKRIGLDLQLGKVPTMTANRQNTNENIFDNIINHKKIRELIKNIDKLNTDLIDK
jgi:hypothetical protein